MFPPTIDNQNAFWAAATAFAAMLLGQLAKLLSDWRKDRRERDADKLQYEALSRIANSNESMNTRIGDLNVHLVSQEKVQAERHTNNIRSMEKICKASCENFKQKT